MQICKSESSHFDGCGLLYEPDPKRRSTLCNDCKKKYGVAMRLKVRADRVEATKIELDKLPERPTFNDAVRIPIMLLEPVFCDNVLMRGRYSRHGNRVEVRPHWRKKGDHHANAPFVDWFDIETGTNEKELKVTGLWLEKFDGVASHLSGRLVENPKALRIEIHRQGTVYAAFYCHG